MPGDTITLWAYRHVNLADARLYKNGRLSEGQLVFGLFYVDERLGEVGERPLLHGWTRTTTLLSRKLEKAYHLLTTRDLNGLRQEVIDCWKWKTGKT